ncbi:diguanylate cyclase [Cryobacterium sp. CG_9.6]|uniref:tetratricopeptide repeat-containing diguanylate cyclase n=1 Tax=Cryobacterium sp. CG_9.6 TaxID=2760710 RepID=UPI00247376EC|nr:diguanylate cyclase [Cryobacterium sp. CG_9.6]MDH6237704.1 diguanylate cyclase (GGDEF)-like protein [Cryobacterium sp. CG_9.6]
MTENDVMTETTQYDDGSTGAVRPSWGAGSVQVEAVHAQLPNAMTIDAKLAECERLGTAGQHRAGAELAESVLASPGVTRDQQAHAREMLSLHYLRLGDCGASVRHGLLAMEFLTVSGDLLRQSKLHCTLALAYHETALKEPALRHVLAALEAARACGSHTAEFWAVSRSAMVHEAMGDAQRGVELGRQALEIAATLDDPEAAFAASNNLCDTFLEVAKANRLAGLDAVAPLTEGLSHARQAVALSEAQGHSFYESIARTNLVSTLIELGQNVEAREQVGRAKAIAHANGFRNLEINNDAQLATIFRAEGNLDEATAMMDAQLQDPSSGEDLVLLTALHRGLFEMHKASGRYQEALHHFEQLHDLTFRMAAQTAGLQSKMLINTIEIEQARHEAERARLEAQVERIRAEEFNTAAQTDPLTQLPNRRALDRALPIMVAHAREADESLCAAMIDFDHFKRVNDTFGHAVGDQVLVVMSALLREVTRETDLAVRMGGEEFLLVFADTRRDQAEQACQRLLAAVRGYPWNTLKQGLSCSVSAGVAKWQPGETSAHWLARADSVLFAAKRAGRDQVIADAA